MVVELAEEALVVVGLAVEEWVAVVLAVDHLVWAHMCQDNQVHNFVDTQVLLEFHKVGSSTIPQAQHMFVLIPRTNSWVDN